MTTRQDTLESGFRPIERGQGLQTTRKGVKGERGAGLVTSILGTFFVLATVYACVDVLVTMHRRTVVTAVADDLARRLARDVSLDPLTEATISAKSIGPGVRMTAVASGDDIVVAVSARGPSLLPFDPFARFSRIERTMRARRELFRAAHP